MRGPLPLLLAALACAAPGAWAQSYERAYQLCLRKPSFEVETVKACTAIIDARRTSPEDRAFALNNRAQGRSPEEAVRDIDAAIRLAPHVAKLYRSRARTRRDPRQAIGDLDQAIRLDPNYAVAWNDRGEAHAELRQYDAAIRDFSEAIRLAPRLIHPLYNPYEQRARAKEAKGDVRGAEADRALYMPLWERAGERDIAGTNASGLRAWEPLIVK